MLNLQSLILCQFDWPQGAQTKHHFRVSGRVFPDEIRIWIGGLSEAGWPPRCGRASSHPLRAWVERKVEEGWLWAPPLHTHTCLTELISCPQTGIYTIGSPGLRPSDLDWIIPWLSWLPTWWMAWTFPASILHEKTPRNKSALSICCWLCYSGELISADGLPVGLGPKINICLIKTYFFKILYIYYITYNWDSPFKNSRLLILERASRLHDSRIPLSHFP